VEECPHRVEQPEDYRHPDVAAAQPIVAKWTPGCRPPQELATAADPEEAFWQAFTVESRAILPRGGQERCSRRLGLVHSVDPGGLVDVGRDHLQAGQDEKGITLPLVRLVPLVALLASEVLGRISWALDQGADALIAKPVTASALAADACGDDKPTLVMPCRSG
jgi:hypothetical protein